MTSIIAEATFEIDDAPVIVDSVCTHLRGHGVGIEQQGMLLQLKFHHGFGHIGLDGRQVRLRADAPTPTGVAVIKEELASHFIEFAPQLADAIVWSDAADAPVFPPWLALLTVVNVQRVTPLMQRITFRCSNVERFAGFADIHMRLMFPINEDTGPQWPVVGPNGVTRYPPSHVLAIRKYTFRRVDIASGRFEVDFVLHEDAGPGSDFAARAQQGDVIAMGGPGGRSAPPDRDWYLLAGDETALPAIARILENLPATARGFALIEVANADEEQSIDTPSRIEVRWLHRGSRRPEKGISLEDAVRAIDVPKDGSSVFVWVGCEFNAFKTIRAHFRQNYDLAKQDSLVLSYWRQGQRFSEFSDE